MKAKLLLALLLAALFLSSGCTQLETAREGGENLICLARGDYDCVKQSYGPSTWDENDSEDNNYSSMEEMGVIISKFEIEDAVETYDSNGVIKINNNGGEDLIAKNIDLKFKIFGNVSYIGNNSFEVPLKWIHTAEIGELSSNESKTLTFTVPSSKNVFNPEETSEYRHKCGGECVVEEHPWDFDSDLTLSYNYKVPVVFDYRIYDREYYETHTEEVEMELEEYCREYKDSQAQMTSTSEFYESPVSINVFARTCKIFEGERFPLTVQANSLEEFEVLEDQVLRSNNCERETPLKGGPDSPVEWKCDMKAPEDVSTGKTRHLIFEIPYRVRLNRKYPDSFNILKE